MKLIIKAYTNYALFKEKGCDEDNKDESVVTDDVTQSYLNMNLMCVSRNCKHWNKKLLTTPEIISQAELDPELHDATVFLNTDEAGKKMLR